MAHEDYDNDEFYFYAKELSECCGARSMIVRSREGGFVTKNCIACGTPSYIKADDFPDIRCNVCQKLYVIQKHDGTNYYFVCTTCDAAAKVADVVPEWSEKFRRHGIAAFGDDLPNS